MRAALVVALVAVLIRLVPLPGDAGRPLFSDERDYDSLARTLAATGRYEEGGRPTAYRPVGYPAVVAVVYRFAGPRPVAVRVVQAVFDGATTFFLFSLFRRRGERTALGAAALWAAFPPAILYTHFLRPETVSAFLLAAIAVAISKESSRSTRGRFLVGALLGLTVLVKSEFLLVLPVIPFLIERGAHRARRAALLLAGALVVIGPWVARNAVEMGAPTLSTSFGGLLLIGNHPNATGGYAPGVPHSMLPRSEGETAASAEAARSAAGYMAAHPGRFVAGVARKWALTLMAETELVVTVFHPDPGDASTSFRAKARAVPAWLHLAVSVPYAALLILGTIGLVTISAGESRGLFLAVVAAWLVAHGLTFGGSRYHFPWMPFLAGYSATLLADRRLRPGTMGARPWILAAMLCAMAIAIWVIEIRVVWGPSPAP
jgi:4-amino-4-deoxy-L-arabinose transferase-like glycosyltransferase